MQIVKPDLSQLKVKFRVLNRGDVFKHSGRYYIKICPERGENAINVISIHGFQHHFEDNLLVIPVEGFFTPSV